MTDLKKDKLFHPRNKHQGHYDFKQLKTIAPDLAHFVAKNKYGNESIDFANPDAVKTLNFALLKSYYDLQFWQIPKGFLCPPIPGRADYIHQLADLLATSFEGKIPTGPEVRILDIGVGANCIFPIIGVHEYGWSFVGAELNPVSYDSAKKIVQLNPKLNERVMLKLQESPKNIFHGIITEKDYFFATLCNPPFHASQEEAAQGSRRKWKNLGRLDLVKKHEKQNVNFGGQATELWCDGGERAFTEIMILESKDFKNQCRWFSTLVSKEEDLAKFEKLLEKVGAEVVRVLPMAQGQKKSRALAWSFMKLTSPLV